MPIEEVVALVTKGSAPAGLGAQSRRGTAAEIALHARSDLTLWVDGKHAEANSGGYVTRWRSRKSVLAARPQLDPMHGGSDLGKALDDFGDGFPGVEVGASPFAAGTNANDGALRGSAGLVMSMISVPMPGAALMSLKQAEGFAV